MKMPDNLEGGITSLLFVTSARVLQALPYCFSLSSCSHVSRRRVAATGLCAPAAASRVWSHWLTSWLNWSGKDRSRACCPSSSSLHSQEQHCECCSSWKGLCQSEYTRRLIAQTGMKHWYSTTAYTVAASHAIVSVYASEASCLQFSTRRRVGGPRRLA